MEELFIKLLIKLVPGLMAITCHEVSHGFVAHRLGDNTAKSLGRLTLNPIKHLDPIGTLMLLVIHIGWAKPVPVNYANLRRPKTDMIWIAAAGPITNFTLATVSALAMRALIPVTEGFPEGTVLAAILNIITLMLAFSVYINLILGIFNLIPVPPLDGGRVAIGLLPHGPSAMLARLEPFGMIAIILLVFFTDVFSYVLAPALGFAVYLLTGPNQHLVYEVVRLSLK